MTKMKKRTQAGVGSKFGITGMPISEFVEADSPRAKLSKARIEALKQVREQKLKVIDPRGLTPEIQRNRIDCLIFFHVVQFGWGPARKSISRNGKDSWVAYDVPASRESRFGYPDRGRIDGACAKIRKLCPEAKEYQQAFRKFKKARVLYLASETAAKYENWLVGKYDPLRGGRAPNRSGYFYHDHKKKGKKRWKMIEQRKKVRLESKQEIMKATAEMARCRAAIFDTMGVPPEFRSLA